MKAANDNIRDAIYDDPAWKLMELSPMFPNEGLYLQCRQLVSGWFVENVKQRLGNLLWFVKFEHSYRQREIGINRSKIRTVK